MAAAASSSSSWGNPVTQQANSQQQWEVSYTQDPASAAERSADAGSLADTDSSFEWLQFPSWGVCAAWKVILRYAFVGISLVFSGTFMTVVGYLAGADDHIDHLPAPKIRFKLIGPILIGVGVAWIAGATVIGTMVYRKHCRDVELLSPEDAIPHTDPMAYPSAVTVHRPSRDQPRRGSANRGSAPNLGHHSQSAAVQGASLPFQQQTRAELSPVGGSSFGSSADRYSNNKVHSTSSDYYQNPPPYYSYTVSSEGVPSGTNSSSALGTNNG